MKGWIAVIALLAICRPPAPLPAEVAPPKALDKGPVEPEAPKRGRAVMPGVWSHRTGLTIHIPEGWDAWEGLSGDIRLLNLYHREAGVELHLYRIINLNDGEPPIRRPDCEWIFRDSGQHLLIPALSPAATSTCIGREGNPLVVRVWVSEKRDADFAVEAVYPDGNVVGGNPLVEPLLKSLRWR